MFISIVILYGIKHSKTATEMNNFSGLSNAECLIQDIYFRLRRIKSYHNNYAIGVTKKQSNRQALPGVRFKTSGLEKCEGWCSTSSNIGRAPLISDNCWKIMEKVYN